MDQAPSKHTGLKAALAGMIAVWVMDRFDWFAFRHESSNARRCTESVRPEGMHPAHALAAKVAKATGLAFKPKDPHRHPAGLAIHYVVPMGLAILYSSLKRQCPAIASSKASGAGYGIATFVILDEIINPILGLAARPGRYPWQRHARELTAHLIYGIVMDALLRRMESHGIER